MTKMTAPQMPCLMNKGDVHLMCSHFGVLVTVLGPRPFKLSTKRKVPEKKIVAAFLLLVS